MQGYPEDLDLKTADWPEGSEAGGPGHESSYVPQGFLLGAPAVMFPYRDMPADAYYGAQAIEADPIRNAPLQDDCGGTLYFRMAARDDLGALLGAMGVTMDSRDYVAFAFSALDPVAERYLDQMRIVTHAALTTVFRIDKEALPARQSLSIKHAVSGFMEAQDDKWNEPGRTYSSKLSGTAGGDGDWAKESLAFGFHVENSYWGVYRTWSRAWLVTK